MPRTAKADVEARMVSRPFLTTLTDVPQELADHLRARDLRWSWQRKEEVPNFWGTGMEAVSTVDLPESLQEDMRKHGIKPTAEGWIQKHDTVLCVMPQHLWEIHQQEEQMRRDKMERRGELEELEEQFNAISSGRARLYKRPGSKATPRSFVHSTRTAADLIAEEE